MTLHPSRIPRVDAVLAWEPVSRLLSTHPRPVILDAVRSVLGQCRERALAGSLAEEDLSPERITFAILSLLAERERGSLRRVVNGTGVVIHTNLGRAPLSPSLRERLLDAAFSYSTLEFDVERGGRGERYSHVEPLLCQLTGAEAAVVVNNNAAAVLLVLTALASGREVIVSRGELVEIGGSFRVPDVMRQGGAILREVGTTNRTHPADYRSAIGDETALLLKVHASNYRVMGFTAEVPVEELAAIAHERGLLLVVDAGSGNLVRWEGVPGMEEPTVREYLAGGADIVTFSGDKLLGGAQGGIIVGRREPLERLKKHPLMRALRVDKLTLAALEGTLLLYRDERRAREEIPVLKLIGTGEEEIARRGKRFVRSLRRTLSPSVSLRLVRGESQVGGGAMPLVVLPTRLIAVEAAGLSPEEIERRLRLREIPVIGRISRKTFLLDVRTMDDRDLEPLRQGLESLAG